MFIIHWLFSVPRKQKRIISVVADTAFLLVAYWSALVLRFGSLVVLFEPQYWLLCSVLIPASIACFIKLGLYRAILRYLGAQALMAIAVGVLFSTLWLVLFAYYGNILLPRTVPFVYAEFALLLVGGSRALMRALVGSRIKRRGEPVIIYGAGASGRRTAMALSQSHEYSPFAFVDDDASLHGTSIQGFTVYPPQAIPRLLKQRNANRVLLAMPSVTHARRHELLRHLESQSVKVLTLPSMTELVDGEKLFSDVKEVEIEDLLGREAVAPRPDLIAADIKDKVVMVTGAGGSIGSELCRQIISQQPRKLVLFELSEFALYSIDRELTQLKQARGLQVEILPLLGSVQRQRRIHAVMKAFKVQTVYHAAAYKHVPLVEYNVVEGVRNNIFGTLYTVQAAISAKVETFVLVSTDKAVRPTNVMGTTKRLAELILQAFSHEQSVTRFCMVRFGNVLGSSGSVVPLFRQQIADGGPVTVTHPDITRFFMTIPEAAQLVIQAGAMGKGGDVFVLDMGSPVKILDLATKMIRLSGLRLKDDHHPDGDIAIAFTGLRPGEKLYEELLIGADVTGTDHGRIMSAKEQYLPWEQLSQIIARLDDACHHFAHDKIRDILLSAPAGFQPSDAICDLVWQTKADPLQKVSLGNIIPFTSTDGREAVTEERLIQ